VTSKGGLAGGAGKSQSRTLSLFEPEKMANISKGEARRRLPKGDREKRSTNHAGPKIGGGGISGAIANSPVFERNKKENRTDLMSLTSSGVNRSIRVLGRETRKIELETLARWRILTRGERAGGQGE